MEPFLKLGALPEWGLIFGKFIWAPLIFVKAKSWTTTAQTTAAPHLLDRPTQTFKQLQLERLLKSGAVNPASKLAETKELELQRVRDFEQADQEEQRQRKKVSRQPPKDLDVPLTREHF